MRILAPEVHILTPLTPDSLTIIERAGRTCYRSTSVFTADTSDKFVRMLIERGHESVLEHLSLTVRFITDRGVLAELTRHRLSSFSVESTRFNDYSKAKFGNECTFIKPFFFNPCAGWDAVIRHDASCPRVVEVPSQVEKLFDGTPVMVRKVCPECCKAVAWADTMANAEFAYMEMLRAGAKPEEARSVLPNSLKTELVMTMNAREVRHVLRLRTAQPAHPQVRQIMLPLYAWLQKTVPCLVDDIEPCPTGVPEECWAKVVYLPDQGG